MPERIGQAGNPSPGVGRRRHFQHGSQPLQPRKRRFEVVDHKVQMHRRPVALVAADFRAASVRMSACRIEDQVDRAAGAQDFDKAAFKTATHPKPQSFGIKRDGAPHIVNVDADSQFLRLSARRVYSGHGSAA